MFSDDASAGCILEHQLLRMPLDLNFSDRVQKHTFWTTLIVMQQGFSPPLTPNIKRNVSCNTS